MADVTVTTTSAVVVPASSTRRMLLLQNVGTSEDIYIQTGKTAAASGASAGHRLAPDTDGQGGGSLALTSSADNGLAAVAIHAVVGSGTGTLNYIETLEADLPS